MITIEQQKKIKEILSPFQPKEIGIFGSYARGDWGEGSDLDLVVVVKRSTLAFERRAVEWDTTKLPVPADLLVYTTAEWQSLGGRFRDTLEKETVWVYVAP